MNTNIFFDKAEGESKECTYLKAGDKLFEIDRVYLADCMEGMKALPDQSIDLILCDLPYGITANKWDCELDLDELWQHYNRVIKPNGAILLFGTGIFSAKVMLSQPKLWRYNLVWEKTTPTGFLNAKRMPLRSHEDIMVFYKKMPTYNPQKTTGHKRKVSTAEHKAHCVATTNYGKYAERTYDSTERYPKSVLKFATDKQKSHLHPTQKPVALLEWLIKSYSNEGEVVLDNCCGAGSTCIAAMNTGRHFIGMELEPKYWTAALERIEKNKKYGTEQNL